MIVERNAIRLHVTDIKTDDDNPNEMTPQQLDGLRESMKRFGYIYPIVVDQNNVICDGYHRYLIYKEFGHDMIPAIRITVKDVNERRLIRQTMNKIKGEHNPLKDIEELEILINNNEEDLKALLNYSRADLEKQKEYAKALDGEFFTKRSKEDEQLLDEIRKKSDLEREIDGSDSSDFNIHKIVIEFDDEDEFEHAVNSSNRLLKKLNLSNYKELYLEMLNKIG
jgi:hypothetical protein